MGPGSEIFNMVLGLCALGYSFVPASRVKNYKRSVALIMRWIGVLLIVLSAVSLLLRAFQQP